MRHWRGVKSGNRGLKSQNFPVNSLLLYAIDRKIVYLRQKYDTSRGNPAGCFFTTEFGLDFDNNRYRFGHGTETIQNTNIPMAQNTP